MTTETVDPWPASLHALSAAIVANDRAATDRALPIWEARLREDPERRASRIAETIDHGFLDFLLGPDDHVKGTEERDDWEPLLAGMILLVRERWQTRYRLHSAEEYFHTSKHHFEDGMRPGLPQLAEINVFLDDPDLIQRAAGRLRDAYEREPGNALARLLYCDALLRLGDVARAIAVFSESALGLIVAAPVLKMMIYYHATLFGDVAAESLRRMIWEFGRRIRVRIALGEGRLDDARELAAATLGRRPRVGRRIFASDLATDPETGFRMLLPKQSTDIEYSLWQHGTLHEIAVTVEQPACFEARLRSAVVLDQFGTVMTRRSELIEETTFVPLDAYPDYWPNFIEQGGRAVLGARGKTVRIDEPVVFIGIGEKQHHFTWLLELLPRIMLAEQFGLAADRRYLCYGPLHRNHERLLELMDIDRQRVLLVPEKCAIEVADMRLVCGSYHERGNSGVLAAMRDRILARLPPPARRGRRLFLSRALTERPRPVNHAKLADACERAGYEILFPEAMSMDDQIAAFCESEIIVAPAGAAMMTAIFAPPGRKIVSLAAASNIGAPHPLPLVTLGHEFRVVVGGSHPSPINDRGHWPYMVDVHEMLAAINAPWD